MQHHECKDFSDNRERYMQQSKDTKNGKVAPLPPREKRELLPVNLPINPEN